MSHSRDINYSVHQRNFLLLQENVSRKFPAIWSASRYVSPDLDSKNGNMMQLIKTTTYTTLQLANFLLALDLTFTTIQVITYITIQLANVQLALDLTYSTKMHRKQYRFT